MYSRVYPTLACSYNKHSTAKSRYWHLLGNKHSIMKYIILNVLMTFSLLLFYFHKLIDEVPEPVA